MDCRQAQDEILNRLDEGSSVNIPGSIDEHLATCPACTAFAASQAALDTRFAAILTPPELSASFRSTLRSRIRRESPTLWPDALPDIVHFASCATATVLCAILLPFAAGPVLAAGATATVMTYLLITAARIWLEA
jgi:predicted anti-sigma-YlaC factor YlaD